VRRTNRAPSKHVLTAIYVRSGRWWHAEIVGGLGLCTQGRTLTEAARNLRDVVSDALKHAPGQVPS
jgi:hypothetical protein